MRTDFAWNINLESAVNQKNRLDRKKVASVDATPFGSFYNSKVQKEDYYRNSIDLLLMICVGPTPERIY